MATPTTWVRYTGNRKGAYMGWAMTPINTSIRMKKTLPGLTNFYFGGQWIYPGGGLPAGAMLGRHVIQIICKSDKRPFVTSTP
jgi:phytoene dehydrogenase-like protein